MRFILLMAYAGPMIYVMVRNETSKIELELIAKFSVLLRGLVQQPRVPEILLHVDPQEHDHQLSDSRLHSNRGDDLSWHHLPEAHQRQKS